MNADLLAMLYVIGQHGKATIGTAYPLDGRHLITARHVVCGQGDDPCIEAVLYGERDQGGPRNATVAWVPEDEDAFGLFLGCGGPECEGDNDDHDGR